MSSLILAQNFISNGNFEQGNTGFFSEYLYTMPYIGYEGSYSISTDPQIVDPSAYSYGDHTSGQGLFFIVNGSTYPNKIVWSESVPVENNKNYIFEMWISTWYIWLCDSGAILDIITKLLQN
jgi:hypothetical protein